MEINIIVLNAMFLVLGILFGIFIEKKKKEKEILEDIKYYIHIYKKLDDLEKENKMLKARLEND
ncbi:TPA: hypothetical protein ACG3P3_001644 [Clostridioides difficile]